MPELPEVETVARDLRGRIVGASIVDASTFWDRTLRGTSPVEFVSGVAGRRIEGVSRRGKQVVIELSGDAFLTIHLKMTGQLFVVPQGGPPDPYVRLLLELDDGREIRFRDIRKFGRVGLYVPGDDPFVAVGPEPLDDAFTLREFRRRLRKRKGRLKPLLVNQAFIAGIGNIYADEALWLARLHPLRSASSLRPPDEARLYRAIRSVLAEAVERRGSSIDDYTAPDGDGEMQEQLRVYQRTGEACPRCGHVLRRIVIGARSTHFCSWCQRLPAADRRGADAILRTMTPRAGHRGAMWTELEASERAVGLSRDEATRASAKARTARTRQAARARRAAARAAMGSA